MSERIGFRVEVVKVEGGREEGRLVANTSKEAADRFVQGIFRRFGQRRAETQRESTGQTREQATSG